MAQQHNSNNSRKNSEEPTIAPEPDRWYNLTLGSSFKDQSSTKFCTLRYEFKPASIDKNQPGSMHKNKENRVSVEFHNNQHGKPKVTFEGSSEDHKENDAVLFFDGEAFRLERLHRAVKRLRHVRLPGESMATTTVTQAASVGPITESSSSPIPVGKATKFQSSNKAAFHPLPVEVERIDVGDSESLGAKLKHEKAVDHPSSDPNPATASPDFRSFDLEEALNAVNDDDCGTANKGNAAENEFHSGIDINIPHQNETDDEIADVDVSGDEPDKGRNAAEALRAQVNAEGREDHTSSSSGSSGSESSGSGSGSGSQSSSTDSESSDSDSINSV